MQKSIDYQGLLGKTGYFLFCSEGKWYIFKSKIYEVAIVAKAGEGGYTEIQYTNEDYDDSEYCFLTKAEAKKALKILNKER